MPQIFKVGSYVVYFWSNEHTPLEPIHVHISNNVPQENATKIWLTQSGKCLLCHNNTGITAYIWIISKDQPEYRQKSKAT